MSEEAFLGRVPGIDPLSECISEVLALLEHHRGSPVTLTPESVSAALDVLAVWKAQAEALETAIGRRIDAAANIVRLDAPRGCAAPPWAPEGGAA